MRRLPFFAALLFLCTSLSGQMNIDRSDFEKINRFYSDQPAFILESEIVLYANNTTTQRYETERAVMKRKGDRVLHRIDEIETLTTATLKIGADHADKRLSVEKQPNMLIKQVAQYDLDLAFRQCSKGESKTIGSSKICRLEFKSGELEKMEVRFNKSTYQLEKLIFFYRDIQKLEEQSNPERPRIEINYTRQDFKPQFESGLFEESRFVILENGRYRPAAKYRNYRFFDNTKK